MKNATQDGIETGSSPAATSGRAAGSELVLGRFGEALLVRVNGRIVLRGGTMADRMEAIEWMALFMPNAIMTMDG